MVRHVQDSDFSDGIACIQLPSVALQWAAGQKGVLAVFDLKVLRQDASMGSAHVLRDQLSSFSVQTGSEPLEVDDIAQHFNDALAGDLAIDSAEVRRGYELAKRAAETKLDQLYRTCVEEFGTAEAVLKQIDDFALAWVEAI
jgi:hypothetical protein